MLRLLCLVFSLVIAFSGHVYAQSSTKSAYQVTGIDVDVTAKSGTAARDLAITTAQRKAYEELLVQLGNDSKASDKISDNDIAALVQNFEVESEKHSGTRYIGRYTVQFKQQTTSNFLSKKGMVVNEESSPPQLVLPITKAGKRYLLWEEPTTWKQVWDSVKQRAGATPMIMPAGDLDDLKLISTAEAVGGKPNSLAALIKRYEGAAGAVVLILTPPDDKNKGLVEASIFDKDGDHVADFNVDVPSPDANTKLDSLLANTQKNARRMIRETLMAHKNGTLNKESDSTNSDNKQNAHPDRQLQKLAVSTPINSLPEWAMIKKILDGLPMVTNTNMTSIGHGQAVFDLEFQGELRELQDSLGQHDMSLGQSGPRGDWLLVSNTKNGVTVQNTVPQ